MREQRGDFNVGLVLKEFHNWIFMIGGREREEGGGCSSLMSGPDLTPSVFSRPARQWGPAIRDTCRPRPGVPCIGLKPSSSDPSLSQ